MTRAASQVSRGYFGIGIQNVKNEVNLGTLWRTAHSLGADFLFTISRRYDPQCSDTTRAWLHVPLYHYQSIDIFRESMPRECRVVGVEISDLARPIQGYTHPARACYVLGAEDHGLSKEMVKMCSDIIVLPGSLCLNVSVAGALVMYDRLCKVERGR